MSTRSLPKHAVILAAGLGSRLKPLTDYRPKPLVEVHGVPILHNTLATLAAAGVAHVTIVVGYRKDAIEYACGPTFAGMAIDYVHSDVFAETGSAYSLWLAREALLADNILLVEGDVLFDLTALDRLNATPGDVAAVDVFDEEMTGSAVTIGPDGVIQAIHTGQSGAAARGRDFYKTVNLFRFRAHTLQNLLVPHLDRLSRSGPHRLFFEQVLADLIGQHGLRLAAAICSGLKWSEIDDTDDLARAEITFRPGDVRSARALASATTGSSYAASPR